MFPLDLWFRIRSSPVGNTTAVFQWTPDNTWFHDSFSGSAAGCVFCFGHLAWSLSCPFPESRNLCPLLWASGRIWWGWSGFTSVKQQHICANHCLVSNCNSQQRFLMERQQSSSMSWPRGVWDLQHWKYLSGWGWPPRIPPGPCLILDSVKLRQTLISTMMPCPQVFLPLPWNSSYMDCLEIVGFLLVNWTHHRLYIIIRFFMCIWDFLRSLGKPTD